jgi:MinD-like ATPase involved in chromosome partitioning or flagellar assembly
VVEVTVFGFVSAKGAPGVTTTSLAVATAIDRGDGALFCELDPSGGDLSGWINPAGAARSAPLRSVLRRDFDLQSPAEAETTRMHSLIAPCDGTEAAATIVATGPAIARVLSSFGGVAVIDGGRWSPDQPTADRLAVCDLVAVVCRPTVASVQHASFLCPRVADRLGVPVAVVLIGAKPYGAGEVAAAIDTPVVGVITWDPSGAQALLSGVSGRRWRRSQLARSARVVLANLRAFAAETASSDHRLPFGVA